MAKYEHIPILSSGGTVTYTSEALPTGVELKEVKVDPSQYLSQGQLPTPQMPTLDLSFIQKSKAHASDSVALQRTLRSLQNEMNEGMATYGPEFRTTEKGAQIMQAIDDYMVGGQQMIENQFASWKDANSTLNTNENAGEPMTNVDGYILVEGEEGEEPQWMPKYVAYSPEYVGRIVTNFASQEKASKNAAWSNANYSVNVRNTAGWEKVTSELRKAFDKMKDNVTQDTHFLKGDIRTEYPTKGSITEVLKSTSKNREALLNVARGISINMSAPARNTLRNTVWKEVMQGKSSDYLSKLAASHKDLKPGEKSAMDVELDKEFQHKFDETILTVSLAYEFKNEIKTVGGTSGSSSGSVPKDWDDSITDYITLAKSGVFGSESSGTVDDSGVYDLFHIPVMGFSHEGRHKRPERDLFYNAPIVQDLDIDRIAAKFLSDSDQGVDALENSIISKASVVAEVPYGEDGYPLLSKTSDPTQYANVAQASTAFNRQRLEVNSKLVDQQKIINAAKITLESGKNAVAESNISNAKAAIIKLQEEYKEKERKFQSVLKENGVEKFHIASWGPAILMDVVSETDPVKGAWNAIFFENVEDRNGMKANAMDLGQYNAAMLDAYGEKNFKKADKVYKWQILVPMKKGSNPLTRAAAEGREISKSMLEQVTNSINGEDDDKEITWTAGEVSAN